MKIKRSKYVSYFIVDGNLPDFSKLLIGDAILRRTVRILASSALTESEYIITIDDFICLFSISSEEWTDVDSIEGLARSRIMSFAKKGLIITNLNDKWAVELRHKEDDLFEIGWHARAATFYFLTKWRGLQLFKEVDLNDEDPYTSAMLELEKDYSKVPQHLVKNSPPADWAPSAPIREVGLPQPNTKKSLSFTEVLFSRVSERRFGRDPIPLDALSTVLALSFRPTGKYVSNYYTAHHKTTPSGGGLHPTEAFVAASAVKDLEPGIYHYHSNTHKLYLIKPLTEDAVRKKIITYAAGQPYVLHSGAVIILTQRFNRHFWKYYRNDRAALVLSMDVGALAQTLYLSSTYIGLPGFFTAAINSSDIEDDLSLCGAEHGAVGLFVLGSTSDKPSAEITLAREEVGWWE